MAKASLKATTSDKITRAARAGLHWEQGILSPLLPIERHPEERSQQMSAWSRGFTTERDPLCGESAQGGREGWQAANGLQREQKIGMERSRALPGTQRGAQRNLEALLPSVLGSGQRLGGLCYI